MILKAFFAKLLGNELPTPEELTAAALRATELEDASAQGDANAQGDATDPYPYSRRASAAQIASAGIRNGMSADEVEACLARFMAD